MHCGCQCAWQKSRPPKHISHSCPSRTTSRQMKHTMPLVARLNVWAFTTSILVVLHCGQPCAPYFVRHSSSQCLCACTEQTKHTHLSCSVTGSTQNIHSPIERDLGGVRLFNLRPLYILVRLHHHLSETLAGCDFSISSHPTTV